MTNKENDRDTMIMILEKQTQIAEDIAAMKARLELMDRTLSITCADVSTLKTDAVVQKAQWKLFKKLAAGAVTIIGITITILSFLASHGLLHF